MSYSFSKVPTLEENTKGKTKGLGCCSESEDSEDKMSRNTRRLKAKTLSLEFSGLSRTVWTEVWSGFF